MQAQVDVPFLGFFFCFFFVFSRLFVLAQEARILRVIAVILYIIIEKNCNKVRMRTKFAWEGYLKRDLVV